MAVRKLQTQLRLVGGTSSPLPAPARPAASPEPPLALESLEEPPPSSRLSSRGGISAHDERRDMPDAQLVVHGMQGDNGALEVLYRRHVSFAIHLATRIEGSDRDVEDIVHDSFLKAFERLRDLTDRAAFRSWLGAIVVHAVRSRLRRTRLMNVLGIGRASEPVDLDAIASHDASPHARAQIAQIYALLRTLPTDERIAWTLRAVEGHDLETVARLTRCSLATVKRRIGRAQRFLDDHFVDATGDAPVTDADSTEARAPGASAQASPAPARSSSKEKKRR
jgi:RNA polymerase sigma-70 factor, ECF subfamily